MPHKGDSWEKDVASYVESRAYDTIQGEDLGGHEIDVYAHNTKENLAIECKDYSSKIKADHVRQCKTVAEDIGARPGLAHTSEMQPRAKELAEKYNFIVLTPEIVYEEVITEKKLRDKIETSKLLDIGITNIYSNRFLADEKLIDDLMGSVQQKRFSGLEQNGNWLRNRLNQELSKHDEEYCIPTTRDFDRLRLYFFDEPQEDVYPPEVSEEKIRIR